MDWIETMGDTIEEAKDIALDRLGVAADDAEFEVLGDAETGWFGRVKTKARVRARVRPNQPREKQDDRASRRGRGRRSRGADGGDGRSRGRGKKASSGGDDSRTDDADSADGGDDADQSRDDQSRDDQKAPPAEKRRGGGGGRSGGGDGRSKAKKKRSQQTAESRSSQGDTVREDLSVDEQAEVAKTFMADLLEAFEIDGRVEIQALDDETREVNADGGEGIGLLIGPRGRTVDAIQELVRTTIQRRSAPGSGRVRIDVGGYRQRRREALERFAQGLAEEVEASGEEQALEPMNAADRKVVHDAVAEIDGITTRSDGEDPRRYVVICRDD